MRTDSSKPLAGIRGVVRRDDTIVHIKVPAGSSRFTWAVDDRQFVSIADGADFANPPIDAFHSRIYALRGNPPNPEFEELTGYPHMPMRMIESDYASFWGGSCLAVDDRVYQFLMTTNHAYLRPDVSFWPGFRPAGAKLIYSPDNGVTWNNQDGSHPVIWDNWDARSRNNMVFFNEEPPGAFAWPSFLQMGKGYQANKDGYVYVYSTNGGGEGTANQVVMFRVPKDRVLDRSSFEFFSGRLDNGDAVWTKDIARRGVMHTFPDGWVSRTDNEGETPAGWALNVVYNEPLGVYMMAGQGTGVATDGGWFGKPSYLGLWVAATPWGPFQQFHEDTVWTPGNDSAARCFEPQIASKWIAADGTVFWLVWADYQFRGPAGEVVNPDKSFREIAKDIVDDAEYARVLVEWSNMHAPRHGLNMQRFDLIL